MRASYVDVVVICVVPDQATIDHALDPRFGRRGFVLVYKDDDCPACVPEALLPRHKQLTRSQRKVYLSTFLPRRLRLLSAQ